ncbi:hypothetical protein C2G38_96062 [Gigaspora rosea]|uniref:AAR2 C-terminal domain-containing protein n=1 Tax=Gigaspora rosea TaxID=44941 RepID=A0A397US57_9GLOM|nr:hypothetical protein C2G38_96062 [Gigaspora rosea]
MCKEAINTYVMTLFSEFIDVINFQLEECPADFFRDIISEDNFLSHVLKVILVLICTLSHLQSTLSVQFVRTLQRNLLCCI